MRKIISFNLLRNCSLLFGNSPVEVMPRRMNRGNPRVGQKYKKLHTLTPTVPRNRFGEWLPTPISRGEAPANKQSFTLTEPVSRPPPGGGSNGKQWSERGHQNPAVYFYKQTINEQMDSQIQNTGLEIVSSIFSFKCSLCLIM